MDALAIGDIPDSGGFVRRGSEKLRALRVKGDFRDLALVTLGNGDQVLSERIVYLTKMICRMGV